MGLAEVGVGAVYPEIAAAGVDVEAEGLGRGAEGDIGVIEGQLVVERDPESAISPPQPIANMCCMCDVVSSLDVEMGNSWPVFIRKVEGRCGGYDGGEDA